MKPTLLIAVTLSIIVNFAALSVASTAKEDHIGPGYDVEMSRMVD